MSRILNVASVAAVGMTAATMLLLAEPGFASDLAADANFPALIAPSADAPVVENPADVSTDAELPVEDSQKTEDESAPEPQPAPVTADSTADSLAELVAATPKPADIDPELRIDGVTARGVGIGERRRRRRCGFGCLDRCGGHRKGNQRQRREQGFTGHGKAILMIRGKLSCADM